MPALQPTSDPELGLHANGTYYLRASLPGLGYVERSTGEKDFRRAQKAKKEMLLAFAKLDPAHKPRTYKEIAEEAFKVKQKGNRSSTSTEARYIYDMLIAAFGHMLIEEVTDKVWITQLDLWRRTTSRKTYRQVRVYAVQIDNYAFRKGYKQYRCDFPVKDPKKREGRVISDKEFEMMLQAAVLPMPKQTPPGTPKLAPKPRKPRVSGEQLRLFLVLARAHGMRRSEALKLTWDRVNWKTQSILLRPEDTKTGSRTGVGREFAIAPEALPFLLEARKRATTPWVFPNPTKTGPVRSVKTAIRGLKQRMRAIFEVELDFRPHDLRHTFLTQKLLVEKLPPMDVAIFAGVSLQVIQKVYLHPKVDDTRHVVGRSMGDDGWQAYAAVAGLEGAVLEQARLMGAVVARDVTPPSDPKALPPGPADTREVANG